MLLVLLLSSVCFIVAFGIGSALLLNLASLFNEESEFTIPDKVLAGLCVLMIWCNVWSIFFPVNYQTILFPLLCGIFFILKYKCKINFSFSGLLLFVFALYLLFSVVPPFHGDSEGYHFTAIRWIETYKAVPGLANIHGRLGFNSSYFPLSAAFSFSKVLEQPVFPINLLLTVMFAVWLYEKVDQCKNEYQKLLLFVLLIYSFRWQLINLSSPSPDSFPAIAIIIIMVEIVFIIRNNKNFLLSQWLFFSLLAVSAFTVKLSCLPIFLPIGVIAFVHYRNFNRKWVIAMFSIAIIVCIPWMIRGVITSGYLIYPLHEVDFFSFDWKAPVEFAKFDRLLIKTGPRMIEVGNLEESQQLSILQWVPRWLKVQIDQPAMLQSLLLLIATFSTAVIFLVKYKNISRTERLIWSCSIVSILFWIYSSPDYRFGYPFLLSTAFIGFSWLRINISKKMNSWLMFLIAMAATIHYGTMGIKMLPANDSLLVYPTLNRPVFKETKPGFPSITMNNGSTLYIADTINSCLDAGLPCTNMFYPGFDIRTIKARGKSMEEGFKIEPLK